jgi:hypothetical protein
MDVWMDSYQRLCQEHGGIQVYYRCVCVCVYLCIDGRYQRLCQEHGGIQVYYLCVCVCMYGCVHVKRDVGKMVVWKTFLYVCM